MGLDMYLSTEQYVSGYDFYGPEQVEKFNKILEVTGLKGAETAASPSLTVSVTVAYWRKVNAIHQWFVQNVQDGKDECQRSYVSRERLEELNELCGRVVLAWDDGDKSVAAKHLPPTSGFFFGSTDLDDYYIHDVRETLMTLTRILSNPVLEHADFYYQSSW